MKKILFFLILLVFNLTRMYSQTPVGMYEVYFVGWLEGASNHHCGRAYVEMTLNSSTGNEIKKIFDAEYGENSPRQYFNKNNTLSTFSANKSLSKLYFSTTRYERSSCRGPRPHNSGSLSSGLNISCYTLAFQFSQFTNEDTDGNGLWNSSFTLYIRPKLVIVDNDPSNNLLPTEERVTINSHSNFKYAEYNWQYRINGSSWVSLPQYNGQSSISINATDILGSNAENYAGQSVDFQQIACNNKSVSNIVSYNIRKSSPHILSVTSADKICWGAANGKLKVHLDRALFSAEKLHVYYKNLTTLDIGEASVPILDADNSFYLNNLSAGDYEIQIASKDEGQDTPNYSDGPDHKNDEGKIESFPVLTYSTVGKTDITCFRADNGSITIKAGGGDERYTLHWRKQGGSYVTTPFTSPTQTTLSDLEPGIYEYYVLDTHGCELRDKDGNLITRTETLAQPAKGLDFAFLSPTEPSGYGRSDGSVALTGDGGTPLPGNTYTVIWKNKVTNQIITTVENDPSGTKFRTTVQNIPAGTYTVEIKDANNCTFTDEIILSQPKQLIVTIENTKPVLCNGDTNGELVAHAQGGVLEPGQIYTYQWYKKNGTTYQTIPVTDSIAANLGKGDYKVEVKDKSRTVNIAEKEFSLDHPAALATSLTKEDVTCFDGSNGSIRIEVSGGVGGYKLYYKKKDDINYSRPLDPQGNVFTLRDLTADEYRIYITDANGCTAPINGEYVAQITISQPSQALEISNTVIKPVSGFGRLDGSITIQVKGGTPNASAPLYNVTWKNASGTILTANTIIHNGVFTSKIENLPEGVYTVEIKDKNYAGVANACYVTASFTVIQPDPLTLQLENTHGVYCHGEETGELIAHVRGGVSGNFSGMPYSYKWYKITNGNAQIIPNQSDSILSNRPAGSYKVSIEDGSSPVNTIESAVFEIAQPPLLTTVLKTRNISCHGLNDGFIRIEVSGGTGSYKLFCKKDTDTGYTEYPIQPDNTTFLMDNLFFGTYNIYIQDANGCYARINSENIHEITLTQPDTPLVISGMTKTDASGFGRSDGNIKITVEGGTPNPDNTYHVVWKNEDGQTLPATASIENGKYISLLNNIPKGNYTVEVKDKNYAGAYPGVNSSCTVTEFYSVSEPEELLGQIEETHFISCNGMSDGQLTVHAKGGIRNPVADRLPYIYKWYKQETGKGYTLLTSEKDSILSNISTGTYKVEIEDYSRTVNTLSVNYNLEQPALLQASATEIQIICGQTTQISAAVTGGTAPYTYQWSTGDKTASVDHVTPGRYFVFVTDSRGCETTAIAKVSTPAGIQVTAAGTNPICYGASNGSIQLQVTGGTSPYTYKWNNGATTKDLKNLKAGLYTVVVSDKDGCTYTDSFILTDPEPLTVYLGEDRTLCNGQSLTLAPAVADTKTKFSWTGPNSFSAASSQISVDKAGTYKLTITDSKGCQASDEISINVRNVDISSEIFVATEVFAGDTIVVANISDPNPDSVEWLIEDSDSLKVVDKDEYYARVLFSKTGYYKIGFRAHKGDCFQEIFKTITVVDKDGTQDDPFGESIIEKYYVYPNPNDGNFNVKITLSKTSAIRLRIINIGTGNTVSDKKYAGQKQYDIPYNKSIAPGSYVVVLETASGHMNLKMIVR